MINNVCVHPLSRPDFLEMRCFLAEHFSGGRLKGGYRRPSRAASAFGGLASAKVRGSHLTRKKKCLHDYAVQAKTNKHKSRASQRASYLFRNSLDCSNCWVLPYRYRHRGEGCKALFSYTYQ